MTKSGPGPPGREPDLGWMDCRPDGCVPRPLAGPAILGSSPGLQVPSRSGPPAVGAHEASLAPGLMFQWEGSRFISNSQSMVAGGQ